VEGRISGAAATAGTATWRAAGTTLAQQRIQGTIDLTFPMMMVRQRLGPLSVSPPSPSMVPPESEISETAPTSNIVGLDAEHRTIIDTMAGNITAIMDRSMINRTASSSRSTSALPPHEDIPPTMPSPDQPLPHRTPPMDLSVYMDPRIPLAGPVQGSPASLPWPLGRLLSPGFAEIMAHLVGMHGGPAPQPPWAHDEWQRLMEMTMADTGGVKKVASDEGLDQVKRWTFRLEKQEGGGGVAAEREGAKSPPLTCAITQMPFEDGDEVAEMPCGHKFDAESLTQWLQRESAQCPVCRHELPSREVARSPAEYDTDPSVEGPSDDMVVPPGFANGEVPDTLQPIFTPGVQGVPAGLLLIGGPGGRGFLFTRQRLEDQALQRAAEQEQQIEDDMIEAAILASVMRESQHHL